MTKLLSKKEIVYLKTLQNKTFIARSFLWEMKRKKVIDSETFETLLYTITQNRKDIFKRMKRKENKKKKNT